MDGDQMKAWESLAIRKQLVGSIMGLTALLGLAAVLAAGLMLWRAQSNALTAKGLSLAKIAGEAVGGNVVFDESGNSGNTEHALGLIKADRDLALAAIR
jgi:hypothetical protein